MVKKYFFKKRRLNGKKICLYLGFLDSARNEISKLEAYSLGCTIEIRINKLEKVKVEVEVGRCRNNSGHGFTQKLCIVRRYS